MPNDSQTSGSEFWDLIDQALARGIDPEKAVAMHQRFYRAKAAANKPKPEFTLVEKPPTSLSSAEILLDYHTSLMQGLKVGLLTKRDVRIVSTNRGKFWAARVTQTWDKFSDHFNPNYSLFELHEAIKVQGGVESTQRFGGKSFKCRLYVLPSEIAS